MVLLPLVIAAAAPSAAGTEQLFERWERRLRTRISELHTFPGGASKKELGDVVISFSIGKDGRPANAVIQKSSGNPTYDKAARRVVRLLGPIGPVPSVTGRDHRVQLKLSYGEALTAAADRQLTELLDIERQTLSQRNLAIVTKAVGQTKAAGR